MRQHNKLSTSSLDKNQRNGSFLERALGQVPSLLPPGLPRGHSQSWYLPLVATQQAVACLNEGADTSSVSLCF